MDAREDLFTDWDDHVPALFGEHPVRLRHRLHASPLFADAALERLIEATPRARYHVNTDDPNRHGARGWREGEITGLSGAQVIEAVRGGRLWVHLQRVGETDPAYAELLDALFAELERRVPGLRTYKRSMSLLISSPDMNVAYHCDVPGQMLWQVRGRKRLWVYPNRAPFLRPEALERIILKTATDTEVRFEPWFDAYATVFDLEPGDMAHWPLNGPHRVVNHDCLNVSFTTEHWTDELRARYATHYANGLLRRATGARRLSAEPVAPGFYAKFALAGAHKLVGLRGRDAVRYHVDFSVDPTAPRGLRDIPAYELAK